MLKIAPISSSSYMSGIACFGGHSVAIVSLCCLRVSCFYGDGGCPRGSRGACRFLSRHGSSLPACNRGSSADLPFGLGERKGPGALGVDPVEFNPFLWFYHVGGCLLVYVCYLFVVTKGTRRSPRSDLLHRRRARGRLGGRGGTTHGFRCGVLKNPDCAPSFNLLVNKDTLVAFHVGPGSAAVHHSIVPTSMTFVFGKKLGLMIGPRLFFGGSHFHVFKRFAFGGARRGFCKIKCSAGGGCMQDSAADRCHCDNVRVGP